MLLLQLESFALGLVGHSIPLQALSAAKEGPALVTQDLLQLQINMLSTDCQGHALIIHAVSGIARQAYSHLLTACCLEIAWQLSQPRQAYMLPTDQRWVLTNAVHHQTLMMLSQLSRSGTGQSGA